MLLRTGLQRGHACSVVQETHGKRCRICALDDPRQFRRKCLGHVCHGELRDGVVDDGGG